mmetsp:Transcript_12835/g.39603  ORF Transcript_12835/g.39603 Transcript_12835/m.39603 type:complete len:327 (-) Transcript_12835:211-1191(-)
MRLHSLCCLLAAATVTARKDPRNATRWFADDTWFVLVGASRYFANYRHAANVLALRKFARAAGVPRERILVLLAEDPTLDARNPRRGQVFLHANGDQSEKDDVALDGGADGAFEEFADADYVGDEVTPELVRVVLSGRHDPRTPRSKRLESTDTSNVFVYLTGHGGDEFLKFHDADELSANEVADALAEMRAKRRYGRLVLMVDTCQAGSLFNYLDAKTTPRVLGIASAKVGENAYAGSSDADAGVAYADRFTEAAVEWLERAEPDATWGDFADALDRAPTRSTLTIHDGAWATADWRTMPLRAFFGAPDGHRLSAWPPPRVAGAR